MANPILVTGAAGRVGGVGRTITEQLLKQGKAVRAMVRSETNARRHCATWVRQITHIAAAAVAHSSSDSPGRLLT
jgi:nucleoside-diphosphate-sugar epimerase